MVEPRLLAFHKRGRLQHNLIEDGLTSHHWQGPDALHILNALHCAVASTSIIICNEAKCLKTWIVISIPYPMNSTLTLLAVGEDNGSLSRLCATHSDIRTSDESRGLDHAAQLVGHSVETGGSI